MDQVSHTSEPVSESIVDYFDSDNELLKKTVEERQQERDLYYKRFSNNIQTKTDYSFLPPSSADVLLKREQKRKRIKIALIISIPLILVIALICILFLVVFKSNSGPFIPMNYTSNNGYNMVYKSPNLFGPQIYSLLRDKLAIPMDDRAKETQHNQFINEVNMTATLHGRKIVRLLFDYNKSESQRMALSKVNELVFSEEFLQSQKTKTNIMNVEFQIKSTSQVDPERAHGFEFLFFNSQSHVTYIDSTGESFIMMTQYQKVNFRIRNQALYGLGESFTSSLALLDGTYTFYPFLNPNAKEDGKGANQMYGSHPLIVALTQDSNFFGIFINIANAMEISLSSLQEKDPNHPTYGTFFNTQVNITSIGGVVDIFFFFGPSYQEVIRQYQFIIGKPALLPYWSHGLMYQSNFYTNTDNIISSLTQFFLPDKHQNEIDIVGIPIAALKNRENMNLMVDVNKLSSTSPFQAIKYMYPFSHFLPSPVAGTPVVQVNGVGLQVIQNKLGGYCLDPFDQDNVLKYIQEKINMAQPSFDIDKNAIWMFGNTPQLDSYDQGQPVTDNPYSDLNYYPGIENNYKKYHLADQTLPLYAKHKVGSRNYLYHADLHSVYGIQFVDMVQKAMPNGRGSKAFIISDSTFPGSGKIGIAHIFPRTSGSALDYQQSLINLINFNMFGIPFVGPNIGGYTVDTNLMHIMRYYEIAIFSPLAIQSMDSNDDIEFPYNYNPTEFQDYVFTKISQRKQYLIYMRTELYKVSKYGGAFIRSFKFDYPQKQQVNVNDFETILVGEFLRAELLKDISLESETGDRLFTDSYLDLNNMDNPIISRQYWTIKNAYQEKIPLFQKGNGTILVYQEGTPYKIDDLYKQALTFSIFADEYSNQKRARGNVIVEWKQTTNADEPLYVFNFYSVRQRLGIITFNVEESNTMDTFQISVYRIKLTFIERPIQQSCLYIVDPSAGVFGEIQTAEALYQAQNLNQNIYLRNKTDSPLGQLPMIKMIFYSDQLRLTQQCDQTLMQTTGTILVDGDYSKFIQITQPLNKLLKDAYMQVYLNITLLTDNSIYFHFSTTNPVSYDTPTGVYDRNFTKQAGSQKLIKIDDVLTVSLNPFYFEVHQAKDVKSVIYTTKGENNFFHEDLNIFSALYPMAPSTGKFYGLGERNGEFYFLNPSNPANMDDVVSLFANANNVESQIKYHGKNGYYPVLFSRMTGSELVTCMWTISSVGHDVQMNAKSNRVSIYMPKGSIEQVLIFGLEKTQTSMALHDHIQFGQLKEASTNVIMPPPEWTFGQYYSFSNVNTLDDLKSQIQSIQNTNLPFEGMFMELDDLHMYLSYTFNYTKYGSDIQSLLDYLQNLKAAIVQIDKQGLVISQSNPDYVNVVSNNITVKRMHSKGLESLVGQDEAGEVIYADYSVKDVASKYIDNQTRDFIAEWKGNKGVQMIRNEITNLFCNGDCNHDNQDDVYNDLLYLPGSKEQYKHTLGYYAERAIGNEYYVHNLNGLIQQIAFSNSLSNHLSRMPVFTDSSAVGSGKLGFVCRIIDYIDLTDASKLINAVSQILTMSIMGMPLVGYRMGMNKDIILHDSVLLFSALNPVSVMSFTSPLQNNYQQIRYSLLKYARTQTFLAINLGIPFLRPTSYEFQDLNETFLYKPEGLLQFMYGPSILALLQNYLQPDQVSALPQGLWCEPYYFSMASLNCQNPLSVASQLKMGIYLRSNYITPLQPTTLNTAALKQLKIDLHLPFPTTGDISAQGNLFVEDQSTNPSGKTFCLLELSFSKNTLLVTYSDKFSGDKQCSNAQGFQLGQIIFYTQNDSILKFAQASAYDLKQQKLNDFKVKTTQPYVIFDFSSISTPIASISHIDFK